MRTSIFLGTALTILCASGIASAAKTTYTATMNGLNERPTPVAIAGTGTAILTFDDATKKLCGTVTYQNATSTIINAHIHNGDGNTAGGVFIQLPGFASSPFKVNLTLDNTQATNFMDLQANPKYVNIHSQNNQGGEMRGQLELGGTEQACEVPDGGADAGTDAGTDGGSDSGTGTDAGSSSGSSGNTSSGSSGATTTPSPDGGAKAASSSSGEDDGCSTTGSSPAGNGLAIGLGAMIAIGFVARARKRAKR